LRLDMDDGTSRHVDHALLATGYRIDVSRYQFLSEELIRQVRSRQGYPDLRAGFEASVPGLHFLGAAAALSFGPILRFVCGTRYAQRRLAWPPEDPARQVEFLLDLGRRYRLDGWLLIPTGDETAALLAQHHARLAHQFRMTTPPWDILRWAYDKRLTHQLAGR